MLFKSFLPAVFLVMTAVQLFGQRSVDQSALDSLAQACELSHSASFTVWKDGRPLLSHATTEGEAPLPCYSVLKSIASLAVGKLIADGQLDSVETPVYILYPEWNQGFRKSITVRHLLNHTSGLYYTEQIPEGWQPPADQVQFALCADLVSLPGDHFNYNNKAFMLLLGVIGRAAGTDTHRYIEQSILEPLGITNYTWEFDSVGNTVGLATTSEELVKVGQLVLNRGMWNGKQIIPEDWIDLSMQPGQPYAENCGLMWWRLPENTLYIVDDIFLDELRQAGIPDALLDKFESLRGTYRNVNISEEKLAATFGENWQDFLAKEFYPYFPARSRREYSKNILGYKAEGWLGQYIVIYPEKGLVAARMVKNTDDYDAATDEMRDFEKYVYNVVKEK